MILAFNPLLLAGMTGAARSKYQNPAAPEDEKLTGNPLRLETAPEVLRVLSAHRNALENIPVALIMGLVYVLARAPTKAVAGVMGLIVVSRWLHSLFFLLGLQPWRTLSFAVAALCTLAMLIHTVILLVA